MKLFNLCFSGVCVSILFFYFGFWAGVLGTLAAIEWNPRIK